MPNDTQNPGCPLCGGAMEPVEVRNSLSRYVGRYICNHCGAMEAMFGLGKMHPDGRECLYFEQVHGSLALVNSKINGFKQLAVVPPANRKFVREYITAVNERMEVSEADAVDIVGESMFVAELTWTEKEPSRDR